MPTLNAKLLDALKPPGKGRIELTDTLVRGLWFRLTAKGVATRSLQISIDGERRRFSLGSFPTVGLKHAREKASRLREAARVGHDPIREAREAKAREAAEYAVRQTVGEVLEAYKRAHLGRLRAGIERERQLSAALATYLTEPIGALDRRHLQSAIDAKAAEGKLTAANRLRAALSHFISWCHQRGHVGENFGTATARAAPERPRERVLALEEMRRILTASHGLDYPWGPFLRVLVFSAQRVGDVAQMRWGDIEAERWSVPGSRTKNGQPHLVHLTEPARAALRDAALAREARPEDLIFTTTGRTPVSGFSAMKRRLDRSLASEPMAQWTLHDIRTAFATHLAEAGEAEGVVDRVLNHAAAASSASAVARVYNRATMLPQRAQALQHWADMLTNVKAPHGFDLQG